MDRGVPHLLFINIWYGMFYLFGSVVNRCSIAFSLPLHSLSKTHFILRNFQWCVCHVFYFPWTRKKFHRLDILHDVPGGSNVSVGKRKYWCICRSFNVKSQATKSITMVIIYLYLYLLHTKMVCVDALHIELPNSS